MNNIKIAVDGPAGVGKSSLAKLLAKAGGLTYIDSGAMYRTVGLYCLKNGIPTDDEAAVSSVLDRIDIDMTYENGKLAVFLNGDEVSGEIRTPEGSIAASEVAVIGEVRKRMVELQRKMSEGKSVIMDGRDIGTKVFPDAELKLYLTASAEKRAERRFKELEEKVPYEEILADIKYRDENDSTRKIDPLRPAEDAIILDNTGLDLKGTFEEAKRIAGEKLCISFAE